MQPLPRVCIAAHSVAIGNLLVLRSWQPSTIGIYGDLQQPCSAVGLILGPLCGISRPSICSATIYFPPTGHASSYF